jgi:hypothetical protein
MFTLYLILIINSALACKSWFDPILFIYVHYAPACAIIFLEVSGSLIYYAAF